LQPVTLLSAGKRYPGETSVTDGGPETAWLDYVDWVVVLTEDNDPDSNGMASPQQALAGGGKTARSMRSEQSSPKKSEGIRPQTAQV